MAKQTDAARRPLTVAVLVAITLAPAGSAGAATKAKVTTKAKVNVTTTLAPAVALPEGSLTPFSVDGVIARTYVAAARNRKTSVYSSPTAPKADLVLDNKANFSGRHVFMVLGREGDWLRVLVPARPNGRTGWVRGSDITLYTQDYAIVVSLSQHLLTLYKGGKPIQTETVGVGTKRYPTPTGSYFIREVARPANPKGAYGPYAFGLSGYSNVLQQFGRGDGQIAIHGTNAPKALGTDVSHGCIRVSNTGITKMAKVLPQGVPVDIRA